MFNSPKDIKTFAKKFSFFFCTDTSLFCQLYAIIQTSTNSSADAKRSNILKRKNTFGSAAASDLCGLVGMFMDDIFIDWEVCEDVQNYHQIISQIF